MPESVWVGTLIVLLGGLMTGSFALPMKYTGRWTWENVWLLYSLAGLIATPWIVAWATVPNLMEVYANTSSGTLWTTALFGFGWGLANVLFGLAVSYCGMALAFALVGGMSAAIGSLTPLLILNPERVPTPGGKMILLGVLITVCGVALLGTAGRLREKTLVQKGVKQSIGLGILMGIVAGCLGPMLNFSFVFGSKIADQAVKLGADAGNAQHAIWAIGFLGGFVGNGGYAIVQLFRNGTWARYRATGLGIEWPLSSLMGFLFTLGLLIYGRGARALGDLGPSIGWPVFQATTIMVSTIIGAASGEWRNAQKKFVMLNVAGLAVLIVAIVVLSFGNRM